MGERLVSAHRDTITACIDAGRTVTDTWPTARVPDSDLIVPPLTDELGSVSLREPLLGLLYTAVDTTGYDLRGDPVPAPPYLVVTSRGPVCRGTLEDGRRLVVLLELFEVHRRPRGYSFLDPEPANCPAVRLRE